MLQAPFGLTEHAVHVIVCMPGQQEVDLDFIEESEQNEPRGKREHGAVLVFRTGVVHLDEQAARPCSGMCGVQEVEELKPKVSANCAGTLRKALEMKPKYALTG